MSSGSMGNAPQSLVSACDVTNCSYNQAHQCHAGSIQVSLVNGGAVCATYTPAGGAVGIGSSEPAMPGVPTTMDQMNDRDAA